MMSNVGDPAKWAEAVTPSDTVSLTSPARSLYIGGTGTLSVEMYGGGTANFAAVPVGVLPVQVTRVNLTGTSATSIVALR
jgi:hypothetical protein